MPELPEIETLVRGLREKVAGKTIVDAHVGQPKALNMPVDQFRHLVQSRVDGADRHGKSAILHLGGFDLWLHLGLGGRVYFLPDAIWPAGKFLAFRFAEDGQLAFDKVFMGHAHLFPSGERPRASALGTDALAPRLSEEGFAALLRSKPKLPVKAALMEQSLIAGVGNSYSDEILVRAHLYPETRIGELTDAELAKAYQSMREVLRQAADEGGEEDWHDLGGSPGRYEFDVHGADHCGQCGGPVEGIAVGGRKGYYCPKCQPKHD